LLSRLQSRNLLRGAPGRGSLAFPLVSLARSEGLEPPAF
jgi:hypothetical protein